MPSSNSSAIELLNAITDIQAFIASIPQHKFSYQGIEYEWYPEQKVYMRKVRELTRNMSFGELCLQYGGKRSATVKCQVDCEFATLNKPSFKRSMEAIDAKRRKKKVDFFCTIPAFKMMSRR